MAPRALGHDPKLVRQRPPSVRAGRDYLQPRHLRRMLSHSLSLSQSLRYARPARCAARRLFATLPAASMSAPMAAPVPAATVEATSVPATVEVVIVKSAMEPAIIKAAEA